MPQAAVSAVVGQNAKQGDKQRVNTIKKMEPSGIRNSRRRQATSTCLALEQPSQSALGHKAGMGTLQALNSSHRSGTTACISVQAPMNELNHWCRSLSGPAWPHGRPSMIHVTLLRPDWGGTGLAKAGGVHQAKHGDMLAGAPVPHDIMGARAWIMGASKVIELGVLEHTSANVRQQAALSTEQI